MEDYKIVDNKNRKIMTIDELCCEYGIGKNTAYRLAHRADAPVLRISKKILFLRSKVDKWMENLINKNSL